MSILVESLLTVHGASVRRGQFAALLVGVLCCVGCNPVGTGSSITGTVKLNGEPLSNGQVLAVSDAGTSSTGEIKPDGTYEVAGRDGKGLQPGHYELAVIAYEASAATDPEAPRKLLVPQQYTQATTSGLAVDIVAGQRASKDIELTGK